MKWNWRNSKTQSNSETVSNSSHFSFSFWEQPPETYSGVFQRSFMDIFCENGQALRPSIIVKKGSVRDAS